MNTIFRLVARAVIIKDGHVLVAQLIGKHSFLPGGQIEVGESSESCLIRELQEELGVTCQVHNYLGMGEQTVHDEGDLHHAVSHFFEVTSDELSVERTPESKEPHLRFYWADVNELAKHQVLPASVQPLIPQLAAGDRTLWWIREFVK